MAQQKNIYTIRRVFRDGIKLLNAAGNHFHGEFTKRPTVCNQTAQMHLNLACNYYNEFKC